MSESTTKQRRHLLVTSIVLILIHYGGVTFGETLKLLGASVSIKKPEVIIDFLLIAQVYFGWRFYQYFYADKAYSAIRSQYRNAKEQKMDTLLMNKIFTLLPKGVSTINGSFSYSQVSKLDSSGGVYEVEVRYPTGPTSSDTGSEMVEIPISTFRFKSIPVLCRFIFRGKILSDYYLPFLLAIYGFVVNFV
jgi:hypothetical protein